MVRNVSVVSVYVYSNGSRGGRTGGPDPLPSKIVSEYDQEIPQSQTADIPMAPQGRATQQSLDTSKLSQATSSLFPNKMIVKLEWT